MDSFAANLPTVITLLSDIALGGFLLEILRRAGWSGRRRFMVAGLLLAWLVALVWRVTTHSFLPNDISSLAFFALLMGSVVAASGALLLAPLRQALMATPHELLLLPQGLRAFLGAGFLVATSLQQMPTGFGIADGLTHITAAFLALKAGLVWGRGEGCAGSVCFANLFGLLDIVMVAAGLSFVMLHDLTPNHSIMLAAFFAAPIFVCLHLISLLKLYREREQCVSRSGNNIHSESSLAARP
ncbi:MAG: hypothetical protein KBA75_00890 [Alphaproteobacteria bacterium]|nr:hypothetical protein [Alphaproteobacteria bacterium]